MTLAEITSIMGQVIDGVRHLHAANIIYRDCKPANILLKGAVAKVADMGCALRLSDAPGAVRKYVLSHFDEPLHVCALALSAA